MVSGLESEILFSELASDMQYMRCKSDGVFGYRHWDGRVLLEYMKQVNIIM